MFNCRRFGWRESNVIIQREKLDFFFFFPFFVVVEWLLSDTHDLDNNLNKEIGIILDNKNCYNMSAYR